MNGAPPRNANGSTSGTSGTGVPVRFSPPALCGSHLRACPPGPDECVALQVVKSQHAAAASSPVPRAKAAPLSAR